MDKDEKLKNAFDELERMKKEQNKNKNELVYFLIGMILFGVGVFWVLQTARVTTNFGGYFYHFGSFGLPNGMIIVPLLIGVVMLFAMERKIWGGAVSIMGILFILITILMNVRITWTNSSAFEFILMFSFIAAGGGLILRGLFKK